MSRGRHSRRSGLLTRLLPGRERAATRRRVEAEESRDRQLLWDLRGEVARLRLLGAQTAGGASDAGGRARRAEEYAIEARREVSALRDEVARLREELLWAWAEGRLPTAPLAPAAPVAPVVDLRDVAVRSA